MHSTENSTGKRTLKRSGKMIETGRSFKGSTGNTANQRSTRNISKKKGKENKEVCTPRLSNYSGEGYWNIIYHWNPADGTSQ